MPPVKIYSTSVASAHFNNSGGTNCETDWAQKDNEGYLHENNSWLNTDYVSRQKCQTPILIKSARSKKEKCTEKSTPVPVSHKPGTIQHIPMLTLWIISCSPLSLKNMFSCSHVLNTDCTYRSQAMSEFKQSTFLSSVLPSTIIANLYCCNIYFAMQPINSNQ